MTAKLLHTVLRLSLVLALAFLFWPNSHAQTSSQVQSDRLPPEKLASYVGQYQFDDNPYTPLSISADASNLFIESARYPRQQMIRLATDVFAPAVIPTGF